MRTFAIINTRDNADIEKNIISKIGTENTIIYSFGDTKTIPDVRYVTIPEDCDKHPAKIRNFVSKDLYEKGINGFAHIIEDSTSIFGDVDKFLSEIELMMVKLKQKSWYNTSCDGCNYTITKYNPRFAIHIDEEECKKAYDKKLYWCSNANTQWICYNMDISSFDDVKLDEKFDIAMFYIIEFLANRRNNKKDGEMYYMNLYPSIDEELKVFKSVDVGRSKHDFEDSKNKMVEEDKIFKEMNINYQPDMNVEKLMDDLYNTLLNK